MNFWVFLAFLIIALLLNFFYKRLSYKLERMEKKMDEIGEMIARIKVELGIDDFKDILKAGLSPKLKDFMGQHKSGEYRKNTEST